MPRFRYIAVNLQGKSLQGEIDSADLAAANQELLLSGLQVTELRVLSEPTGKLSFEDAAAFSQQVSTITQSELPLIGALRAFAEEVLSTKLRQRLIQVCDALEAGEPLERVLNNPALRLPRGVASILGSGLPHTVMNHLLNQTMRSATVTLELRMRAFLLVCYTFLMFATIAGVWGFLLIYLTPQFEKIFTDFGTELPVAVVVLISLSRSLRSMQGLLTLLLLVPIGLLVCYAIKSRLSPAARRRIWCGLPILGSMYRLTALSEVANSLALLLESHVPLPQAVVWSTAGANDADLQACGEDIAARLRWGEDPDTACQTARGLPSHLQQMLRWAAHGAAGAEPLRSLAKLLQIRAKSLSLVALPLMEPILLITAVVSIALYVFVIFMPLIKLLNDLS
ncbi:MAG: type II secretion system F family protein [Planctomycetota bacterium]